MVTASLAVVLFAVSVPSDTVLLDFTAPWCGPCRSMEPTMAQLSASGYPVRKVNVDQERDLARQFHVSNIPCFVLVKNGKELGRVVGPASAGELQGLFAKAGPDNFPFAEESVRGQSPEEPLRRIAPNSAGHQRLLGSAPATAQTMPVSNPGPDANNPFRRADNGAGNGAGNEFVASAAPRGANDFIKYGARLTIEDKDGFSHGSGTIIDCRGDQCLILTCGHVFRDSNGQGKVTVDLFVPGAPKKIPGRVISYDLKRDVGLVSIRPGVPVTAARVAPEGFRLSKGDRVITVGCNNGGEPTAEESQVIAVDKFVGPPNVQVAGQPVQGRSGGGLFMTDGLVVGVCNAADPTDNAGLFAAAAAVQAELDAARLSSVYRGANDVAVSNPPPTASEMNLADRSRSPKATELRTLAGSGPESTGLSAKERMTLADLGSRADGAEVICIVRPRGNAEAKSEVIVLDRASSAFMDQLTNERDTQTSRRFTSLEVPRTRENWRQSR